MLKYNIALILLNMDPNNGFYSEGMKSEDTQEFIREQINAIPDRLKAYRDDMNYILDHAKDENFQGKPSNDKWFYALNLIADIGPHLNEDGSLFEPGDHNASVTIEHCKAAYKLS